MGDWFPLDVFVWNFIGFASYLFPLSLPFLSLSFSVPILRPSVSFLSSLEALIQACLPHRTQALASGCKVLVERNTQALRMWLYSLTLPFPIPVPPPLRQYLSNHTHLAFLPYAFQRFSFPFVSWPSVSFPNWTKFFCISSHPSSPWSKFVLGIWGEVWVERKYEKWRYDLLTHSLRRNLPTTTCVFPMLDVLLQFDGRAGCLGCLCGCKSDGGLDRGEMAGIR